MSAYICNHDVFNGIISYCYRNELIPARMCVTTARILRDENIRSVGYRYNTTDIADMPGEVGHYQFKLAKTDETPTHAVARKLISELTYQSCECPDWDDTEACQICEAILKCIDLADPQDMPAPVFEPTPEPAPARDWTDLEPEYFQTNKPNRNNDAGGTKVEKPTPPPVMPPAPVQQVQFADLF